MQKNINNLIYDFLGGNFRLFAISFLQAVVKTSHGTSLLLLVKKDAAPIRAAYHVGKHCVKLVAVVLILTLVGQMQAIAQTNNNQQNNTDTKVLTAKEVEVIALYYDATTQKLLGNNNEAIVIFLQCVSKDPKNAAAYYELASIYNELKQPTTGLTFAKLAVDLDSKNKWYLTLYADILIQTGKIKQASKVYDQLLKIEPFNQDFQIEKAEILIYLKKYTGAIAIFDKLEKKLGIVAEIILQKQKLYLAQGKYDAAEKEMQRLIDAFPNEPEYYGMFAEFYLNINKKEKAMSMFQKVLELDPNNPIIHLAMANYYQENNQGDKAFEHIKLAFNNPEVELDSKIKIMLSYYDLSANNSQRKKEAEELLDILVLVHPAEPKTWSVKGDFLFRDGKLDEAIAAYEKVIELQNDKYPVWDQLLRLYIETGMYDKLQVQSEKAIELFPNMPMFYYYNGIACFMNGNYQKAIDSYTIGQSLVINDPNQKIKFLVGFAEANVMLKRYADAEGEYEYALGTPGNNLLTFTSYAEYLCNTKKDLVKAKDIALKAKTIEPNNYKVLDVLAWIEYKSGNYSEALNLIQTCLQYGGGNYAKVLEHYGDILFKSGQTDQAIEQWNKAKTAKGKYSDLLDTKIQQQKLVE